MIHGLLTAKTAASRNDSTEISKKFLLVCVKMYVTSARVYNAPKRSWNLATSRWDCPYSIVFFVLQGDLVWFDPGVGHVLPGEVLEFHRAAQVLTVQAVIGGKVSLASN
jgi:hypothetical protein